ncbi:cell wall-binding repeat-containing protein [Microbacterium sp. PRC9]|uniref:cell wall-binding repeat-containing protein n=1 Tax=Microbacterium sp. PRC9 TaxID=2962591 RepID=UPI0028829FF5|nr:cell wall-binding repeat-containing protein [Microbacterium sp. PRC9]MDT0141470.1 cell wall-binding repeat-containing protein [Microbacterium sp. PRC9]
MTATTPAEIEIDHVVALAEAWRSGAWGWNDDQRRAFANDLEVPYALNAASTVANQSKSDHDPAEWLPTNTSFTGEYVIGWALGKYRWSLTVDAAERAALEGILTGDCGSTAVELPVVMASLTPAGPHTGSGYTLVMPFWRDLTRLAGADCYETALATSLRYAANVPAVFVATGANFPDALAAAAAAATLGGPLVLTPGGALPDNVRAEIVRLAPKKIYLVGGPNAVSDTVLNSLSAIAPTTRLGGADRYGTALGIVDATFTSSSHAIIATGRSFPDALAATGSPTTTFLASGNNFPDALAGAALAGYLAAPLFITAQECVPPVIHSAINGIGASMRVVMGGPNAVSDAAAANTVCGSPAPPQPPQQTGPPAKPADKDCADLATQAQA